MRLFYELKFCRSVRNVESPDRVSADIDRASADFTSTGDDPKKLAQAMRTLADIATRTAALEIRP